MSEQEILFLAQHQAVLDDIDGKFSNTQLAGKYYVIDDEREQLGMERAQRVREVYNKYKTALRSDPELAVRFRHAVAGNTPTPTQRAAGAAQRYPQPTIHYNQALSGMPQTGGIDVEARVKNAALETRMEYLLEENQRLKNELQAARQQGLSGITVDTDYKFLQRDYKDLQQKLDKIQQELDDILPEYEDLKDEEKGFQRWVTLVEKLGENKELVLPIISAFNPAVGRQLQLAESTLSGTQPPGSPAPQNPLALELANRIMAGFSEGERVQLFQIINVVARYKSLLGETLEAVITLANRMEEEAPTVGDENIPDGTPEI